MEKLLEEVQFAYYGGASPGTVAGSMKALARAGHTPAVDFFLTCLRDKRQEWRIQSLMLLVAYIDLSGNEKGLDAVRGVLRNDADRGLRMKAAELLSLYATWPEQALIDSLQSDPDRDVCYAALQAILELAGVPRMKIRDEIGQLRVSGVSPSMRDVDRITGSSDRGRNPFLQ
jgi:HEAT repeat protein